MQIKAILLGVLAALFFSLTFLLNELSLADTGYWLWVAALRYIWMLPMIWLLGQVPQVKADFKKVWQLVKQAPARWFIWSNVCFVLFYVPLVWAGQFLPGWLVSSLWQLTIIFGVLTTPLMKVRNQQGHLERLKIPHDKVKWMIMIVIGIGLTAVQSTQNFHITLGFIGAVIAILIAAVCYPLGNRQLGMHYPDLNGLEKVFGMLISTYPTFLILATISFVHSGLPTSSTLLNTFNVALSSGVVATVLFFHATAMAKNNMETLATIEATQSFEVLFTVLLGIIFLHHTLPNHVQLIGLGVMLLGIAGINLTGIKWWRRV